MSDYSIFPKAIDGYAQLPLFVDNITPVNAEGLNRIRSAIVNIENTLGAIPQGDFDTVSLRLDDIDSEISAIESSISTIESNIDAIEQAIFDLPNALFLNEAATPTAQTNKGAIFVSDGSGGLVQNNLYYSNESGVVTDLLAGGGGGDLETTLGLGNETAGSNIILSSGDEIQGQTDVRLRSATDSNIDLISDGSGSVRIYTDNPADGLVFLQMGESQETGLAHIPPGMFGPDGLLILGFPDLNLVQFVPPGTPRQNIRVQSPNVTTNDAGAGVESGHIDIQSGNTGFTAPGTEGGQSGRVKITTGQVLGGSATPSSGEIIVRTGTSTMGDSGDVTVTSGSVNGTGSTGTSGDLTLATGDAITSACSSGNIVLEPGALAFASTGTRGFVQVRGEKLNLENGPNNADVVVTSGDPNGSITAGAGSLALDTTGDLYVGQGGTSWSLLSGIRRFRITDGANTTSIATGTPFGDTVTFTNTPGETTVGVSGSNVTIGLPNTGVVAGTYISPIINVDVNGRITAATTNPGLQGAYDYGNTLVTSGPTDIAFTLSAAGGGFTVNGDGNVLIGLVSPINTFFVSSIAGATVTSQDEIDIIVAANSATGKVLDLSATNVGTGEAAIRLTADDSIIMTAPQFIGGGQNNDASAGGASTIGGQWALAGHESEHAHSSGRFTNAGDAQYSRMVLRRETTSAAPLELSTTGSNPASGTDRLRIANNTAYRFRIDAVAREDATGDTSWWEIKGCIKRGAGPGSVAIVGSQYITTDYDAGASSWQLLVTADTVAGSLKVEATGQAAHTIRWVATVHLTKVNG